MRRWSSTWAASRTVGGRWSRFACFVYAPAESLRYLRGGSRPAVLHDVGHSPLGALSVFGLLAMGALIP